MRFLLDTHAFLWWLADDPKLSASAREALASPEALLFVSAVSVGEVAIKRQLGKIQVEGDLVAEIAAGGFLELPITAKHAQVAGDLPRHHDDPFDRMLLAQAKVEGLTLVTRDSEFAPYGVALLPAEREDGEKVFVWQ